MLEGRLRTSEANAAALGDSHATELAQVPCMPTLTYISLVWRRFGHHVGGHCWSDIRILGWFVVVFCVSILGVFCR
eukprot:COSAG04_NODE_541_length_12866_cov_847.972351_7_plen_76_part_00